MSGTCGRRKVVGVEAEAMEYSGGYKILFLHSDGVTKMFCPLIINYTFGLGDFSTHLSEN